MTRHRQQPRPHKPAPKGKPGKLSKLNSGQAAIVAAAATRAAASRAHEILLEVLPKGSEIPHLGQLADLLAAAGTPYSRSYICYVFLGRRNGSIEMLRALAGVLKVDLSRLDAALTKKRAAIPVRRRTAKRSGATNALRTVGRVLAARKRVAKRARPRILAAHSA